MALLGNNCTGISVKLGEDLRGGRGKRRNSLIAVVLGNSMIWRLTDFFVRNLLKMAESRDVVFEKRDYYSCLTLPMRS